MTTAPDLGSPMKPDAAAAVPGLAQGSTGPAARRPASPRRDSASRWFGYDIFISFALGPPPRGSLSYASDLARRLRERDFTVFFSEEEAAPGERLDSTLRKALHGSRLLVVVVNRGTLQAPRWVRTEVESYQALTPARPIVPISVGGALQDPALGPATADWLPFQDHIWLDESQEAGDTGIVSDALVDRLALAPQRLRANVKWRWLVRGIVTLLAGLALALAMAAKLARDSDARARAELAGSVALRAAAEAPAMSAGEIAGGQERALQQLLAAHAIAPGSVAVNNAMRTTLLALPRLRKVVDTGAAVFGVACGPEPDCARLVTVGSGGRVQRWDTHTLQPVGDALAGPTADLYSVAFSPDGQRIAAAGIGGRLWRWDAESGAAEPGPEPADSGALRSLVFTADGRAIVTGGVGGAVQTWDAQTGTALGPALPAGAEVVAALALSRDGRRLVAGGDLGALQAWTRQTPNDEDWRDAPLGDGEWGPWVQALAIAPNGKLIASGLGDGRVRLWDARTGRELGPAPPALPGAVHSLSFTPDGRALVIAGAGLVVWDLERGSLDTQLLTNGAGKQVGLALSADGRAAVTGGEDGHLRLWDLSPSPAAPTMPAPAPTRGADLSPDGRLRALGTSSGTLRLVDSRSGAAFGEPIAGNDVPPGLSAYAKEPPRGIASVRFSADSRLIATGAENGSIRLWRASPLEPLGSLLLGHDGAVKALAFSPHGQHLVSGGADGTLRMWVLPGGQALGAPLMAHAGGVVRVEFSDDGAQVVTVGVDGGTRAWPAPTAWAGALCGRLTRSLSPRQWSRWLSAEVPYREPCAPTRPVGG